MKNILLLATTLFSIFTFAQVDPIISIPDANFKAKLLAANESNQIAKNINNQWFKIDVNNDGEIQISEALSVSYLNIGCNGCLNTLKISNLNGIESFVNINRLFFNNNNVNSINLNTLNQLKELGLENNQITNLEVNNLIQLTNLGCSFNQIQNLNISALINLKRLDCSNNLITSLNLSNNTLIEDVYCNGNLLNNINIQNLDNLNILSIYSNQLTELNFNGVTTLGGLLCNNNLLTTLDLSNQKEIFALQCHNNQLVSLFVKNSSTESGGVYPLNFSNNPNLQYICCDDFQESFYKIKANEYGYTNCQVNTYCSFPPGGNYNTISGQVKYDFDNSGCDANDLPVMFAKITSPSFTASNTIYANNQGQYNAYVLQGTHTITPQIENPSFFVSTPPSAQVTFSNSNNNTQTQNFCIIPNGVHHDVEVTLIPITPARPGFDATYKIIYKNKGNQVENGTVTLTYLNQDALDIVSCNPAFNSENSDGFEKTLTWNYVNLQPFQTREITVVLNLNGPMETPALNIGETLSMTSTVTPEINDETPIDNHSDIRQVIVGSYDPNDKTCIEGATITPAMVGEYVHYVIRFENTGTYPAQNVVVKDMIDLSKFDIATLIPIKASHNFETRIAGNKVEFIFENINLPFDDANNDGYVAFKIKTKPTLVLGDTFSNLANIYFDYNFPIITNTATTTIAALSTTDFDFGTHFTLYPNPVKEVLHFQSKDNTSIHSIEIYTTLGQVVLAVTDTLSTVDVSSLQAGNYIVKVHTDLGVSNTKFIKE